MVGRLIALREKDGNVETMAGFLEEKNGDKSSTRLFSLMLLMFLFVFNVSLSLVDGFSIDYNFILFNFIMLIGVFAPKYLSKLAESKIDTLKQ